jgi:sugar-phosphatase
MTNGSIPNPSAAARVRAVLFDLDGTLIDTEVHTDAAIRLVAASHGVAGFELPPTETRGRTWTHIADTMRARTSITVPTAELEVALLTHWNEAVADVHPVPGAAAAIRAAHAAGLKVAVVSSSPRSVIGYFIDRLGVGACISDEARIGADSVRRGKPDPEGFLLASRRLGATPAEAVVFEDSHAGLLAARAAGMRAMFITCCAAEIEVNASLATTRFTDYEALPPGFWTELADGPIDLARRTFR